MSEYIQGQRISHSKQILSMLRIYIVNYLASEYGFESFTRDSIDCIAICIQRFIVDLFSEIKLVLQSQRRTIPNFLHLLFAIERKGFKLDNFIIYLIRSIEKQEQRKLHTVIKKFETRKLFERFDIFENNIVQKYHNNILTYPINYHIHDKLLKNPLQIRTPITQVIQKPPNYSYSREHNLLQQNMLNNRQMINRSSHNQHEIRIAMTNLQSVPRKQRKIEDKQQVNQQVLRKQKITQNLTFKLANYL